MNLFRLAALCCQAAREVIAGAAVEPHAVAILACDNPEAIVLYFMQP
jgi:hypothetical protein